jgi:hypothetical protein
MEPASEPAATKTATDDDVFYPPIAVSNSTGRTSDLFQLPNPN